MARRRQLHLNAFLLAHGHHEAAWRHPGADPHHARTLANFTHLARTAERGLLDSVFLADGLALFTDVRHQAPTPFEPLTLLAALATATERVGLIATASTTFQEPFRVCQLFGVTEFC